MRAWFVIGALAAAVFFFAMAVFTVNIADILLVPAGLLCLAIAFFVERVPDPQNRPPA